MTKKKEKVFSHGQMVANMMGNGKMENNTVKEYTIQRKVLKKENGLKVSV